MNFKMTRYGLCALGLVVALSAGAQTQASDVSHGLRLVSSQLLETANGTRVETRISRSLTNRLLSAQQLRIALVAADGSVRAEQRRAVGPAQLPRHAAGDFYLTTELNAVAGPQDHLLVEWVPTTL